MQPISSLQSYSIIHNTKDLDDFCSYVTDYLAIDTEFARHTTYWPRPSLIQLASKNHIAIIDLLHPPESMNSLSRILQNKKIIKIFHAARGDIEILIQYFNFIPSPIFDTQLAACFSGLGENISYTTLVKILLNKELGPSHQKTDWLKRPILPEQMAYAVEDVLYLESCYKKLCNVLRYKKYWHDEEVQKLYNIELYRPQPKKMWIRLQHNATTPYAQHILQALCEFRETIAMVKNKPRSWIISDQNIIMLLQQWTTQSITLDNFQKKLFSLESKKKYIFTEVSIEKLFQRLQEIPKDPKPLIYRRKNCTFNKNLFILFKKLREDIAFKNQIPVSLLCTKNDLKKLTMSEIPNNLEVLQSWRYELFGKMIILLRSRDRSLIAL